MNEHDDFVETVRQGLEAQAAGLDELTLARLRAARRRAVAARKPAGRHWRVPAFGAASAAAVLFAVLLWQSPSAPPLAPEDWELVVSGDDLDLIEEYEFYEWLDATQTAG
ncbi:MAG: DUF3619 family protein [Gammaproteobacteria bacterium]|jgi:hypothetical protein